ncbi:hypothetical protein [Streptomyces sp. NPDC056672]|uniref:hypothetical protein n=1 Tax=Streptomyces sp. NPDC056672 TaxID=3345906 RepID=UPI00369A81F4
MSSSRTIMTVFITVIAGLVLAIIALSAGWPQWTWPLIGVLLLLVPVVEVKTAARRRPGEVPPQLVPYLPATPVESRELRLIDVALPSEADDYDFLFSATVRWCPADGQADTPLVNPGGLAAEAVLERARRITEKRSPGRSSLVQHELNGELSTLELDVSERVLAMAEATTLALAPRDQERLDKLAAVRKDEQLWEHERRWEQSKRAYLGEDVLKDAGSTVVWWLARNDDHVERTVNDLGLLAQLSSAANNEDVPEQFRHLVPFPAPEPDLFQENLDVAAEADSPEQEPSAADHFDAFLLSAGMTGDDPRRPLFVRQVAEHAKWHEMADIGEELLERFDAPYVQESDDTAVPPDPDPSP